MRRTEQWAQVIERISPLRELRTLWVQSRMLLAKLTDSTKLLKGKILQVIATCTAERADRIAELADHVSPNSNSQPLSPPHRTRSVTQSVFFMYI